MTSIYALVGEPNNTPKKILVYDDLKIGAGVAFANGNLYVSSPKNRILTIFQICLKILGHKTSRSELLKTRKNCPESTAYHIKDI